MKNLQNALGSFELAAGNVKMARLQALSSVSAHEYDTEFQALLGVSAVKKYVSDIKTTYPELVGNTRSIQNWQMYFSLVHDCLTITPVF